MRFYLKCLPNLVNLLSGFFSPPALSNARANLLVLPLNLNIQSILARQRTVKLSEKVARRVAVAESELCTLINNKSNLPRA